MPNINIAGMKEIKVVEKITDEDKDLIIVTDAGDLALCLDETKDSITSTNIVYIDHHTEVTPNPNSFVINENRSSATEQVFASFKDILGRRFRISEEIAQLTQYGIVADTGRFLYTITTPDTLRIFADAKEVSNVDLEEMSYKISKFPREATPAIVTYLKALDIQKDMAYMYITEEMIEKDGLLKQGINEAQSFLRDKYIRFIQGVHWGFILKPDFDHKGTWFVSFRSTKGYQDVGKIAQALGGGGHMYSSAAPLKAQSGEEALKMVLNAVSKVTSE
jgi:phosphoesterase RecJ-like protein